MEPDDDSAAVAAGAFPEIDDTSLKLGGREGGFGSDPDPPDEDEPPPNPGGDGGERGPPNPTEDFENLNCLF